MDMACKYNFKNVSLKYKTYDELDECSSLLAAKGEHWSKAKTIEHLIFFFKSIMSNKQGNIKNDKNKDQDIK